VTHFCAKCARAKPGRAGRRLSTVWPAPLHGITSPPAQLERARPASDQADRAPVCMLALSTASKTSCGQAAGRGSIGTSTNAFGSQRTACRHIQTCAIRRHSPVQTRDTGPPNIRHEGRKPHDHQWRSRPSAFMARNHGPKQISAHSIQDLRSLASKVCDKLSITIGR